MTDEPVPTNHTVVPAAYFDDLLAALDKPAEVNDALLLSLRRARQNATPNSPSS